MENDKIIQEITINEYHHPNPEKIQAMLAFMKATQDYPSSRVGFLVTYPNFARPYGEWCNANIGVNREKLTSKAIEIFAAERPDYRVQNLATDPDLLVGRVLSELEGHINDDEVILTNGCCTLESCKTACFIGCTLKALGELCT